MLKAALQQVISGYLKLFFQKNKIKINCSIAAFSHTQENLT